MSTEKRSDSQIYHICCWPVGRTGLSFCGIALIVIGFVWLLSNVGLLADFWWEILLPLLLIGWGMSQVLTARKTE
ncbi:hypothetical protein GWO43_00615 [candidate division KSB1 bacterium]|nr:hypothetical protein [candidate division KSB1 bacterium]NIR68923.1 hypothetical protein [candidate division KSB1 bacterium]NIS22577.1 hypothetical protein [candidate division KSB1 bacterium]NIT69425.1 hypothetical protein [candidate division KSB1 bacterium]NIU23080.1 hypothetical protein [candidate division KSB1 bacterium]